MDVVELVRLLRTGASDRTLTRVLRHNRRTIAKYRAWAETQGLLAADAPQPTPATAATFEHLAAATLPATPPPQQTSTLEPYREEIARYRRQGMEMAAIRLRLEERHGRPVSYSAVWRLVHRLEPLAAPPSAFVRVEVKPGSEAQVDFGYAGLTLDPASAQPRKTWVFVMLLSYSRHLYAELVFDQRIETWLLCHAHAFACFGGVPARVVPDNLKAAVVRASFLAPEASPAYRECAEHYGFLIDPNPPRKPHLKGKVEQGGVHYVKRNFLAGRCPSSTSTCEPASDPPLAPEPCDQLNLKLRRWCMEVAGQRIHGTTKARPLERFQQAEQAALQPLPPTPYDPTVWQKATVGRDCYVTFRQSAYSVPYRLVGQVVWVRGGARTVEIFSAAHELVATHDRASTPGERLTHLAHLPPEKVAGLTLSRERCRSEAEAIGPATVALVESLLAHRPEDRLRSAGRLLLLAQRTSPVRLEQACTRAQAFGVTDYSTVKRILEQGLERGTAAGREHGGPATGSGVDGMKLPPAAHAAPLPIPSAVLSRSVAASASPTSPDPRPLRFVRHASEFVASLLSRTTQDAESPTLQTLPVGPATTGTTGAPAAGEGRTQTRTGDREGRAVDDQEGGRP